MLLARKNIRYNAFLVSSIIISYLK